tara:strand:- start:8238 stop:8531 length:294 start_codon:yes stop_codon:yes gene_type:complete
MFACWQRGETDDDLKYEASLSRRGSQFAASPGQEESKKRFKNEKYPQGSPFFRSRRSRNIVIDQGEEEFNGDLYQKAKNYRQTTSDVRIADSQLSSS